MANFFNSRQSMPDRFNKVTFFSLLTQGMKQISIFSSSAIESIQ